MKYIHTIVTILLLLTLSLSAKETYFDPYKPQKSVKKHTKSITKKKKIVKIKHHKVKKNHKNKKYKQVKISNRLSYSLDKIYKRVLKKTNINRYALKKALFFYKKNRVKKGLSSKYLAIADYTKTARQKRLYIINLRNGAVYRHKIAHGKYSGALGGRVRKSSNRRNSKMTPYGFFKVGSHIGRTKEKKYQYLSVKGLERSNRKVGLPTRMGGRDVVLHPAKYVNYGGRSHGCFSICPQDKYAIFSKLKRALFYSYTGR
ncbi:MAG: murein L,D-transpeptidase catalytic domain family protein [Sulfurovaceae bacterium]|nr:murein L,D-transpeptidase catalytic domain family protein [Sulfurovaceae bacterium]